MTKENFTNRTFLGLIAAALIAVGCSSSKIRGNDMNEKAPKDSVPLEYIGHAIVIPVVVNGTIQSKFILDTGIGLNLISESFCKRLKCKTSGTYTGKRMSGQAVTVPLSTLSTLSVASHSRENVKVGVFPDVFDSIDGILSLEFLESVPFTIDYSSGRVVIENAESLAARNAKGKSIPVRIDRDHSTVGLFMEMEVPGGPPATVEIDTGSDSLILDERYMARLGIKPSGKNVKRVEGKDETGHSYVRYFSEFSGSVHPVGAPEMKHDNPKVMFQKIIYDGLVGHSFFKRFVVTYDLPNSQMILSKPEFIASIPLIESPTESGKYVTDIEIYVDGAKRRFLLDTGAASSSIREDDETMKYPSLGKDESKGASGKAKVCDIIQPKTIRIGLQEISKPKIKRCDRNILGMDLLGQFAFQVDLAQKRLNVLAQMPSNLRSFSIRRLKRGHVTIPSIFGKQKVDVLFDTGADTTVIDSQFVNKHPELFKLIRSEDGTDAHGHKIESKIYECESVELGDLKLRNVEMAAFDFGKHLRESMEGSPVILGSNVISKAVWNFDLKAGKWAVREIRQ